MNKTIHQLFANLDSWRHLPSYQQDGRANVFFSIYLPEYLKKRRGYDVQMVIPDFPIRVGTVRPLTDNNRSFRIDYLVKVCNPSMVILFKLKMDMRSKRSEQDWYFAEAKKRGIRQLLIGLKKIVAASSPKSQYDFLLRSLECAGLIQLSGKGDFRILDAKSEITTMYIQPNTASGDNVITFAELADFVSEKSDDLSKRFAQSLREWGSGNPAGEGG
jgi:hypothetical protein